MKRKITIKFEWWVENGDKPTKPAHNEALSETAMARISTMMSEGYTDGELNDTIRMHDEDGEDGIPYRGWWSVKMAA